MNAPPEEFAGVVTFTGTQRGMTDAQRVVLRRVLVGNDATTMRNGLCVGADAEAYAIARELGLWVEGHPSTVEEKRVRLECDRLWRPERPLVRNRTMVDRSSVVVVAPATAVEQLHSGTWATVRYGHRRGRRTVVIEPDGRTRCYRLA